MKRVLSLFLSCIFVLGVCFSTPVIASAEEPATFVVDDNVFQYVEGSQECSVKKWNGSDVALTLTTVQDENEITYTITGILSGAFSGCTDLETLTIKSNIETIEAGAFAGCTALTEFIEDANSLNSDFEVDAGVLFNENQTTLIAYPAAKEGTEYTIPLGVTEIAKGAFAGCANLKYIFTEKTSFEENEKITIGENNDIFSQPGVYHEGLAAHNFSGEVGPKKCTACCLLENETDKQQHTWENGVCTECGLVCEHAWENGECTKCGLVCEHAWENGECTKCELVCEHAWENGTCTTCNTVCEHAWENGTCTKCELVCEHTWENGTCTTCNTVCEHAWENGTCTKCELVCEHIWENGVCTTCNTVCEHAWENGTCTKCELVCEHIWENGTCTTCNTVCEHAWENGTCTKCELVCEHTWENGTCTTCNTVCEHAWENGTCTKCELVCEHIWENGTCTKCELVCEHAWENGTCTKCELVCEHIWENGTCTTCNTVCEHAWENGECTVCYTTCAHNDKSNKIEKLPTCVDTGVLLTKCNECDFEERSTIDIDSDAHKMSDWTETVKATCSSTGVEERTCENGDCKHTETRETGKNPNNHTYGDWVVTAATCVADGEKVKTCTNTECKHELKETIAKDPTAHKMATEWEVTKAPTCVETGLQVKTCLNVGCDHEIKEVIAIKADAHNLGGWVVTKAAKCTVAGEITRFCKNGNCEYKVTDSLDPDGKTHDFAKDFTVIEATCISTGSKFRACENEGCKEVTEKTEIAIDPDAHKNVETINVKQPTCEEKGYTGDEFCNDCKKTFDPGIEVDALGHTESDWIVDKEATFTEEGARHISCTVCKKELKKEVIEKLTLATPSPKAYNKTSSIKVKWTDVDNALTYNVYRSDFVNNDWTKWKKIGSVKKGVGEFTDKNVVAGKQYKYTVKAYNGEFVSGKKTSNKIIFIKPVKPALTITTTGLILKWDTVLGADKYVVYRSQLVDEKWSDWKKVSTVKDGKTSAVDTSVESGATYKYSVRAYIGSSYTERKASGTIIYLAQPTIKLSNTATGIKGSWETVNGATGYVITRAEYNENTKKFGTAIKLGTAGATAKSFTDKTAKEGVKYKYTLTAINGTYSSVVSSGKVIRRLGEPVVTIENANGSIKGKWTQVKGATNYTVYRSELVDGKWTSWKNLGTTGATAKSFTDKTVKSGVNYKYTVKAINGGSKSSVGASNKVVYLSRPEPTAVNSIYGVKVTWGAITGAESYIVYRKAYVNKQWTEWQQIGTSESNSYIDSTAVSGVKYKYTIHAVNGGSLSARKATSTLLHVATPTATVKATEKAINVSWGQVGGATKYVVYRQVLGADGKWSASTKIASLKGVLEFTDTTAEAGNTYRYKVVAYNGKVKSSSNATDGILLPTAQ